MAVNLVNDMLHITINRIKHYRQEVAATGHNGAAIADHALLSAGCANEHQSNTDFDWHALVAQ